jgi:Superinfection immunity protein
MVLGYGIRRGSMVLSIIFFHFFFGLPFVMYFLPSIIALARSKRDLLAIFLLNLFLGWSIIGWIVALVWAAKNDVPAMVR